MHIIEALAFTPIIINTITSCWSNTAGTTFRLFQLDFTLTSGEAMKKVIVTCRLPA